MAALRASVTKFKENYGSSSFNLMNAILGSGILGLPYVMNLFGYGLFAIMLSVVAFLALFAVDSLLHCCNATELTKNDNFSLFMNLFFEFLIDFFSLDLTHTKC